MRASFIIICGLLLLSPLSGSAETLTLSMSQSSYGYYEEISIYAILNEGGLPVASASVTFEVRDSMNSLVLLFVMQTDSNGNATLTFYLPEGSPLGTYLVYASGSSSIGSTSFSVVDDIAPTVSDPSDIVSNATDNPSIIWDVSDAYPDEYSISVNGTVVQSGSWTNGQIKYVMTQSSGIYEVVLTLTDQGGNTASSTVLVTILNDLPPSITLHNDTSVEVGISKTFVWDISNGVSYALYANGSMISFGSASHVEYVAYSETLGTLNLTLTSQAQNGKIAIDQFTVFFIDTRIEQFSVDAISTVSITEEYNFTVNAQDRYSDAYEIWLDSSLFQNGNWNWTSLDVKIGLLSLGIHDITVKVTDRNGNSADTSFQVTVVDPFAPTISESKEITVVWAESNIDLVWDVFDDYPGTYEVLMNGSVMDSGSWTSGTFIYQVPQNRLGTFNYTLVLYDKSLNSAWSSILLVIIPPETDPPIIDGPTELVVHEDALPTLINWTVIEPNPANYSLMVNGSVIAEGTYLSVITYEFTGSRGLYLLMLTVWDRWGYESTASLTVEVLPPISELVPKIEGPPDVVTSSTTYRIIWKATDSDPDTYSIYIDGNPFKNNIVWSSPEISIEVGNLDPGTHNFTLVVRDLAGYTAKDTVYVTLLSPETTEGGASLAMFPIFAAMVILVRRWKR